MFLSYKNLRLLKINRHACTYKNHQSIKMTRKNNDLRQVQQVNVNTEKSANLEA